MNARDLLFTTGRFNPSQAQEHFINPCCFGEDLAAWLRTKLAEENIIASEPGQEDWGWYLRAKRGNDSYLLGVGGNSANTINPDYGEWRIFVLRKRPIWDRIMGKGKITDNDPVLRIIEEILRAEADFVDVHRVIEANS